MHGTPAEQVFKPGRRTSSQRSSGVCGTPQECATMMDAVEQAMAHAQYAPECTPGGYGVASDHVQLPCCWSCTIQYSQALSGTSFQNGGVPAPCNTTTAPRFGLMGQAACSLEQRKRICPVVQANSCLQPRQQPCLVVHSLHPFRLPPHALNQGQQLARVAEDVRAADAHPCCQGPAVPCGGCC